MWMDESRGADEVRVCVLMDNRSFCHHLRMCDAWTARHELAAAQVSGPLYFAIWPPSHSCEVSLNQWSRERHKCALCTCMYTWMRKNNTQRQDHHNLYILTCRAACACGVYAHVICLITNPVSNKQRGIRTPRNIITTNRKAKAESNTCMKRIYNGEKRCRLNEEIPPATLFVALRCQCRVCFPSQTQIPCPALFAMTRGRTSSGYCPTAHGTPRPSPGHSACANAA